MNINVEYALEVLEAQLAAGYEVAHKNHSSLESVKEEIETKLCFLFEIDGITGSELSGMLDYVKKVHEEELRKEVN